MLRLTLTLLLMLHSVKAHCRWAKVEESAWVTSAHYDFQVNADGSYVSTSKVTHTIKKERGKDLGRTNFSYQPEAVDFKVIKAYTKNADKIIEVTKDNIEDKAIASQSLSGFDDVNRVTINFPQVQIGSQIHYEVVHTVKKPSIKDHWSYIIDIWDAWPILKGSSLKIRSKLPLTYKVKSFGTDFTKRIKITEKKDTAKQEYSFHCEAKEDLYYEVLEETYSYYEESLPYIMFSSSKSVEKMLASVAKQYESVSLETQPTFIKEIIQTVPKKTDLVSKVEAIMAAIIKKIRYSGDWRTVKGAFVPRALEEISKTEYGDCKDYSIVLVTILKQLGYQAHPAWVYRGSYNIPDYDLPNAQDTNHAIVYVNHKGKSYWFDPTNVLSQGKVIFTDISGRKAIVLDPKKPFVENIPHILPQDNYSSLIKELHFNKNKTATVHIEEQYRGLSSYDLAVKLNDLSQEQIKKHITKKYLGDKEIIEVHSLVVPQSIHNTTVDQDLVVQTKQTIRMEPEQTTAGEGWSLYNGLSYWAEFDPKTYTCCGLNIGSVSSENTVEIIKNRKLVTHNVSLNSNLQSPWFNYKREVKQVGDDIVITQQLDTLKEFITNKELQGSTFKEFQQNLRDNFKDILLIFTEVT